MLDKVWENWNTTFSHSYAVSLTVLFAWLPYLFVYIITAKTNAIRQAVFNIFVFGNVHPHEMNRRKKRKRNENTKTEMVEKWDWVHEMGTKSKTETDNKLIHLNEEKGHVIILNVYNRVPRKVCMNN